MKEDDGSIKNLGCSMVGLINTYIYLFAPFSLSKLLSYQVELYSFKLCEGCIFRET
jgi:hypothetical protein